MFDTTRSTHSTQHLNGRSPTLKSARKSAVSDPPFLVYRSFKPKDNGVELRAFSDAITNPCGKRISYNVRNHRSAPDARGLSHNEEIDVSKNSKITIHRSTDPFARVPIKTAQDSRLSLKAKGLLVTMLSLPDNWVYFHGPLFDMSKDKEHAHSSAIEELIEVGYVERERTRTDEGYLGPYDYDIYDIPLGGYPDAGDESLDGKILPRKILARKSLARKIPTHTNIDKDKEEILNKEEYNHDQEQDFESEDLETFLLAELQDHGLHTDLATLGQIARRLASSSLLTRGQIERYVRDDIAGLSDKVKAGDIEKRAALRYLGSSKNIGWWQNANHKQRNAERAAVDGGIADLIANAEKEQSDDNEDR